MVHLAALGSVPRSFKNPIETNSVNVDGSLNILKLSKDLKSKKFIFASSSSVYETQKIKQKKKTTKKILLVLTGSLKILLKIMQKFYLNIYKLEQ